jgi:type I restriction enzyme S subunit
MTEWNESTLEDLCLAINDGDWVETKDQGGNDFRLLQVSNIGLGVFRETGKYRYVTVETFKRLHCREIRPGMVLVARMPDPVGRAWYVAELPAPAITSVDVAILEADSSKLLPRYCMYLLNSPEQLAQREAEASGTTRRRVTRRQLARTVLNVPDVATQHRVVKVLGAIDDLIENNRRRVEVREDVPRASYRERFVHFRFPGHEDAAFVDSDLGPIPEGWRRGVLRDIGTVTVGGDWGQDEPGDGLWAEVACLRGVDLPRLQKGDSSGIRVRWIKENSLQRRELSSCDVVVEGSGECGRALAACPPLAQLVGLPLVYSNFCKRLRCETPA